MPPKAASEPLVLVPRPTAAAATPSASASAPKRTSRIVQRAATAATARATTVTTDLTDDSKGPLECPPGRVLKKVHGKRFCAKAKAPSEYAQPPWLRPHAFSSENQPAKRGRTEAAPS